MGALTAKRRALQRPPGKGKLVARNRELSALLTIAETATQSLDIEKILAETLEKSIEILRFYAGYIRTLEPGTRVLVLRVTRGLDSPGLLRTSVPIDSERRNAAQVIFETKEPYVSSDIKSDAIFQNRTMERVGLVSAMWVPIVSKTRVLGVMVIGSRRLHNFSQREIGLLKVFGSQLGAALENCHLYDEVAKGKAYIESLVENAGDAIFSTDGSDQILTWNRGAEVMFGYSKEDVIGKNLTILLPVDRFHVLEEIRAKVRLSGVLRNMEARGKRKDGAVIHLALSVSPIKDGEGKIVAFLRVAKDVTDKKRFEMRLKELDRMKSDFVSNVSHELRTPLTAIKGSVDNMLDGLTGSLNEKQTRYLARIKSNTDRLSRLINEILDLSKIEAGRIELKSASLSLDALIQEVAEALRSVAVDKLISIETGAPENGICAWADRDKVTQILMNLIGNAIKFTPPHGKVFVSVKARDSEWVQVAVADTGPGIEVEEANKIFDKFYQVAEPKSQKAKGTGLGLAISRALVEMHGGKIWVESVPGAGCTVLFTLPNKRPFKLEETVPRETGYGTQSSRR